MKKLLLFLGINFLLTYNLNGDPQKIPKSVWIVAGAILVGIILFAGKYELERKELEEQAKIVAEEQEAKAKAERELKSQEFLRLAAERHKVEMAQIAERKVELTKELKNSRLSYDEFRNITWIYTKNQKEDINKRLYIYASIVGKDISATPNNFRIKFTYKGREWIFFDEITILSEGRKEKLYLKGRIEPLREVFYGGLYEQYDVKFDAGLHKFFKAVIDNKDIKIRFQGRFHKDYTLTANEKANIRHMLKLYELSK